jgi:hypothetical protein
MERGLKTSIILVLMLKFKVIIKLFIELVCF